jgi:hypothetical protein
VPRCWLKYHQNHYEISASANKTSQPLRYTGHSYFSENGTRLLQGADVLADARAGHSDDPIGNADGINIYGYAADLVDRLVKAVTGSTTVNLTYDSLGRLF